MVGESRGKGGECLHLYSAMRLQRQKNKTKKTKTKKIGFVVKKVGTNNGKQK